MDSLTPAQRSERMARVRGRDTRPELTVRRFVHAMGLRYRVHQRVVGVRPDMVFASLRVAVMVHGCMWHQHPDPACRLARMPKSRLDFWGPKLRGNRDRDERQRGALEAAGWTVMVVWECEVDDPRTLDRLVERIRSMPRVAGRVRPARVAIAERG